MAEKRTSTRPPGHAPSKTPSAPPRRPSAAGASPTRTSRPPPKRAPSAPPVGRKASVVGARPAPVRKETLEVDMTWLEGDESAERLLIEAIKGDKGKSLRPPARRSTKSMPAVKKSAANIPVVPVAKRVMPPSLNGASARRDTLQVSADWLIEEEAEAPKRPSKPPATTKGRRAIPPPLPREDKD